MFVVFPFYDGEAQTNTKWLYVELNFRNSLLCNQNTNIRHYNTGKKSDQTKKPSSSNPNAPNGY